MPRSKIPTSATSSLCVATPENLHRVQSALKRPADERTRRVFPACVAASGASKVRIENDAHSASTALSAAQVDNDGGDGVVLETILGCPIDLLTAVMCL